MYRLLIIIFFLSACGGGGGGGGGGQTRETSRPPPPTFNFQTANAQATSLNLPTTEGGPNGFANTQEYVLSNHLTTINAGAAYAEGLSGEGYTIGMVDRPIDVNHVELRDKTIRYDNLSVNYDPNISHGTSVASVMVSGYNNTPRGDEGTLGVAYKANLVSIGVTINVSERASFFTLENQQSQENRLTRLDAPLSHILQRLIPMRLPAINMSFGHTQDVTDFTREQLLASDGDASFIDSITAFRENDDSIFVFAAGNRSSSSTLPNPFILAGLPYHIPELQDTFIAVVSVDDGLAITDTACGVAKDFCLAVRGENIAVARNNGGYARLSGTSFAAPQVTAALVLVLENFASQNMTPKQAAERLLENANRNFGAYNESLHGRGLLDIGAALEPSGTTSLIGSGWSSPLSAASMRSSPAIGDALNRNGHTLTFFDSLSDRIPYSFGDTYLPTAIPLFRGFPNHPPTRYHDYRCDAFSSAGIHRCRPDPLSASSPHASLAG